MNLTNCKIRRTEKVYQIMVTPEMAKRLLEINYEGNRKVKHLVVERFSQDMASGKWDSSIIEPLHIECDGDGDFRKLLNGQHRLNAIIRCGLPVSLWVDITAKESQYLNMDNGATRDNSDYISTPNKKEMAALAKAILITKNYPNTGIYVILKGNSNTAVSRAEIVECADAYSEEMHSAIQLAARMRKAIGKGSKRDLAYFVWAMRWTNNDECLDQFIDEFCDPLTAQSGTVRLAQVKILKAYADSTKRPSESFCLGVLTAAYLKYRNGVNAKVISHTDGLSQLAVLINERRSRK